MTDPYPGYPRVRGYCPACRGESLFLGEGGYVTCARLDCPEPDAASSLLERRPLKHVREIGVGPEPVQFAEPEPVPPALRGPNWKGAPDA